MYMILFLEFVKNCLYIDAIDNFPVRERTGSNPLDINGFQSYAEKKVIYFSCSEVGMEGNNNSTYTTTHTNNFSSGEQSCPNFAETNNNNKVELLFTNTHNFPEF